MDYDNAVSIAYDDPSFIRWLRTRAIPDPERFLEILTGAFSSDGVRPWGKGREFIPVFCLTSSELPIFTHMPTEPSLPVKFAGVDGPSRVRGARSKAGGRVLTDGEQMSEIAGGFFQKSDRRLTKKGEKSAYESIKKEFGKEKADLWIDQHKIYGFPFLTDSEIHRMSKLYEIKRDALGNVDHRQTLMSHYEAIKKEFGELKANLWMAHLNRVANPPKKSPKKPRTVKTA
jgi:hypothetical protein